MKKVLYLLTSIILFGCQSNEEITTQALKKSEILKVYNSICNVNDPTSLTSIYFKKSKNLTCSISTNGLEDNYKNIFCWNENKDTEANYPLVDHNRVESSDEHNLCIKLKSRLAFENFNISAYNLILSNSLMKEIKESK